MTFWSNLACAARMRESRRPSWACPGTRRPRSISICCWRNPCKRKSSGSNSNSSRRYRRRAGPTGLAKRTGRPGRRADQDGEEEGEHDQATRTAKARTAKARTAQSEERRQANGEGRPGQAKSEAGEGCGRQDGKASRGDDPPRSAGALPMASPGRGKMARHRAEHPGLAEHEQNIVEAAVAKAIEQYEQQRGRGSVPGGLARQAADLLHPKVDPARELLAKVKYAVGCTSGFGDFTYRKPNRRQPARRRAAAGPCQTDSPRYRDRRYQREHGTERPCPGAGRDWQCAAVPARSARPAGVGRRYRRGVRQERLPARASRAERRRWNGHVRHDRGGGRRAARPQGDSGRDGWLHRLAGSLWRRGSWPASPEAALLPDAVRSGLIPWS